MTTSHDTKARVPSPNKETDGRFGGLMVTIDPPNGPGGSAQGHQVSGTSKPEIRFFVDFAKYQVEARNSSWR